MSARKPKATNVGDALPDPDREPEAQPKSELLDLINAAICAWAVLGPRWVNEICNDPNAE
jgi:hypothetical protein